MGVKATAAITYLALSNGKVTGWASTGVDVSSASASQLTHLEVSGNDAGGAMPYGGIKVGDSTTITDCVVTSNGLVGGSGDGIGLGSKDVVSASNVNLNACDGIVAIGSNSRLTGNHAVGNGIGGFLCIGIWLMGSGNIAEDNSANSNQATGFYVGGGTGNVAIQNVARNNGTPPAPGFNYTVAAGNDVGPIGTAAASTSPWANISE
jgi:parallel beta-helix repeat protein